MKKSQLRQLIREEVNNLLSKDNFHDLYIANKDIDLRKTQIPKNTVLQHTGGGYIKSLDGKIEIEKENLEKNIKDFTVVTNEVWPKTLDLTKKIEEWSKITLKKEILKNPSKAKNTIESIIKTLKKIEDLLK